MKRVIPVLLCFIVVLNSCQPAEEVDLEGAVQTAAAQTQVIDDAVATVVVLTLTAKHPTPTVTLTSTPVTPTSTPVPPVNAVTNGNANCRSGPAGVFDNLVIIQKGMKVLVIAKNDLGGIWWQIEYEGKQCWVTDEILSISGDISVLPFIESPPTPTPRPLPTWGGNWDIWVWGGSSADTSTATTMSCTQTGNSVLCGFSGWGYTYSINGTSSADGMTLTGKLNRSSIKETWSVYLVRDPINHGLFRGGWCRYCIVPSTSGYTGAFCGTNNKTAKPSSCTP